MKKNVNRSRKERSLGMLGHVSRLPEAFLCNPLQIFFEASQILFQICGREKLYVDKSPNSGLLRLFKNRARYASAKFRSLHGACFRSSPPLLKPLTDMQNLSPGLLWVSMGFIHS